MRGWYIQQLDALIFMAQQENPNMEVLLRELKLMREVVENDFISPRSHDALLKEFGW